MGLIFGNIDIVMKQFYIVFFLIFGVAVNGVNAQSSNLELIKEYVSNEGVSAKDLVGLRIQRESYSKSLQATTAYVVQEYKGIPIQNAIGSFAIKNGKIVSFTGKFVNNIASKISGLNTSISPENAVKKASVSLGVGIASDIKVLHKTNTTKNSFLLSKGNISTDNIPVTLVFEQKGDKLMLCWDLSIHTKNGENWYSARVDAVSGKLVSKNDWVIHCSFDAHSHNRKKAKSFSLFKPESKVSTSFMDATYNVYPIPSIESPNHGDRQLVSGQEDELASPFGWHDTNGAEGAEFTTTSGNNVIAFEDINGDDEFGAQPDGGANLLFDYSFDPNTLVVDNQDASITNLFYANNVIHDVWYHYGFDEASGNFQFNNYGRGGFGNDEVFADALDGSGFNNANFATPPDGANPRMQMFLWNPQASPDIQVFVVNNTTAAGSYVIVDNNFDPGHVDAPEVPDGITSDLVLAIDDDPAANASDACSDLVNAADIDGKIAVVRRGECNFDDKVFRCQEAGAIAVLVVNNQDGDPIVMGGDNGLINIPAVMIGMNDGEAIITEMTTNTVNITLSDAGLNILANDSSFDNGIVIHEYGHGISTRLAGGANNSGCLIACVEFDDDGNCIQDTEQMGEGWSDWFALMMTIESGDTGADARGIGTFAAGEPTTGGGIRPFPYSTDLNVNPVTYGDTNDETNFSAPHGVGSVWASIIWDLNWALIERDGFDPDLYNGTGGNNLAMQLIIDGLKLQTCNPGFIDGRDGILRADEIANDGANTCLIWEVFARRGVGWSSDQGDNRSRVDQTEAFDLPPVSELNCAETEDDPDIDTGMFIIEPNPSNGIFNIRVPQSIGASTISIYDVNGRFVYREQALLEDVHPVDIALRAGLYILRIEAEDGSATFVSKIAIK